MFTGNASNSYSRLSEPRLLLVACHIGQQHLHFNQNDDALKKLHKQLDELGTVVCDFDLKVKLDRNLLALSDYPFGMKIGGTESNLFDWQANMPKGIFKKHFQQFISETQNSYQLTKTHKFLMNILILLFRFIKTTSFNIAIRSEQRQK